MTITFFAPIYSDQPHPLERFGFLRSTTHFFDFGQNGYLIRYYDHNGKLEVLEKEGERPSWISILLRVVAIATVIMPLVMLIGAWIYRALNTFEVTFPENKFNDLPLDVLRKIFTMTGPSVLRLCATNKANRQIIEAKPEVQKNGEMVECQNPLSDYQIILKALEECYIEIKRGNGDSSFPFNGVDLRRGSFELICLLAPIDPQKTLELLGPGESFLNSIALANIAHAFMPDRKKALELIQKALDIAEGCDNKDDALEVIVRVLASLEFEKALQLTEQMQVGLPKIKALVSMAKATSNSEVAGTLLEQAISKASEFQRESKESIQAREVILQACALMNHEKGLELIDEAVSISSLVVKSNFERTKALAGLAKAVSLFDSCSAADILKSAIKAGIEGQRTDHGLQKEILKVLSLLEPMDGSQVADCLIEIVNQYDEDLKSASLAQIAVALSSINPTKAKEVLALALTAYDSINEEQTRERVKNLPRGGLLFSIPHDEDTLALRVHMEIAKAIALLNLTRMEDWIEQATLIAAEGVSLKCVLAKALAEIDFKRGVDSANSIAPGPNRFHCLIEICCIRAEFLNMGLF